MIASDQPQTKNNSAIRRRLVLDLPVLIYSLFFCSTLFSQITVNDSIRISVPIKEVAVLCFFVTLPFLLRYRMPDALGTRFYFFGLYTAAISIIYSTYNFEAVIEGKPYPVVVGYMYLYLMGIIFSQIPFQPKQSRRYFEVGFGILSFNSYIALFLYVIYFLGLNPMMLGVNHASFYRAFGLMPEPSHFSIISGLTLLIYVYFVNVVKYFKLNKIKFIVLAVSFALSQSPTGFVFFFVCVILYFIKASIKVKVLLLSLVFIVVPLSIVFDFGTIARAFDRVEYDVEVVSSFIASNYELADDVNEYSRFGRLFALVPWLTKMSGIDLLFGLGLGGQNLILPSLDVFFPGPIYLVVELGLLGLIMLVMVYAVSFGRGQKLFYWVVIPYVFICFINSPGGIFGAQFLVLVFFLGNAGYVSSEARKRKAGDMAMLP